MIDDLFRYQVSTHLKCYFTLHEPCSERILFNQINDISVPLPIYDFSYSSCNAMIYAWQNV